MRSHPQAAQFMRRFQSDLSESGAVLVQLADPIIHAMFDAAETSAQGHPNDPSFLHWLLARLSRLFSDHDYLLSDLSSIPDPDGQAGGGAVGRREARRALGRVGRREVAAAVTALVAGVSDVLLSAARASAGDLLSSQGQGQGQTQGATGAGAVHEALDALMPTQTIPSQAPTQGMATQGVAPRPGSHAADLTVPAGCTEARKRVLTSHLTLALGPIFDSPIVRDRVRSQTITGALRDIRIGEIPEEVEMGEEAVAIEPRIHDAIEPTNDSMQARLLAWMPAFCEGALIVAMAACHPGVWGGMVARLLTEMHVALKAIVDALIPIAEAGRVERRTVPGITKIIRSYRDVLSSAQLLTREGLRIEGIQKLVNACDSMLEGRRGPNRHGGPGNSGRGGRGESHSHSAAAGAEHASRHVASPRQRNQGEDGAGRDGGEVTGPAAEGDTTDEGGAASAGAGPDGRAGGGGAAAVTESAGPRSAAERASGPAGDPSGSWRRVVDSGKGAPALKKRGPCTVQSCEALTSLGEDQVGQMRRVVGTIVTMHESRDRSGSVIKLVASVRLSSGPIKEKVAVVLRWAVSSSWRGRLITRVPFARRCITPRWCPGERPSDLDAIAISSADVVLAGAAMPRRCSSG